MTAISADPVIRWQYDTTMSNPLALSYSFEQGGWTCLSCSRAIRSLPSVDVQESSLQDATHKFCRENAHFGPACHRQVLMATLQEGIRAKAKEGGKDVERLLKKHGPDIRKWPFTFGSFPETS